MNHDVFISYSSKNSTAAQAICHELEDKGIKCWMAPRDIPVGAKYASVITKAIVGCRIVVLVFSDDAARSPWVESEINVAFSNRKTIVPYKIDTANIEDFDEFYLMLNNRHWIEAYPDYKTRFKELVVIVAQTLGKTIPSKNADEIKVFKQQTLKGTLIIKTDLDCRVFNYGEEIGVAKAGEYTKFELPLGDNELKYVGLENEEDSYEEPIVIDEKYQKSIRIALLDIYNARKSKEEAEHKAKERAERRIEQNKRLIWSTSRNVVEQQPKKIRLIQVAKEFKVGMSTLIDFLYEKDVGVNWTPNSMVSSDIYSMLEMEFGLKRRVAGYHDILNEK